MTIYKEFETERLIIRPTSEKDVEFILKLINTPKWIKYIGDKKIRSLEKTKEYIQNIIIPQLKKLGFSNYTLIKKSDSAKIGTCGLYDREGLDGIDIGFAFLPEYEGKGFGFESANRLIKAAFEDFDIDKIVAITTKDNVASQKLIEKLGLEFRGTTRIPNDDELLLLYKLENGLQ